MSEKSSQKTWPQRLKHYGLNTAGGMLAFLGTVMLFSDTPLMGIGWLPAGLLLIPKSQQWLIGKFPGKLNQPRAYGLAAALWLTPAFAVVGQQSTSPSPTQQMAAQSEEQTSIQAPTSKAPRIPESSIFTVVLEVTQDDMLLCKSKLDLHSVGEATDPTNEKLKRDYAHDAITYGRIVSDPGFARREMAAIAIAQMRLVSQGKCIQPRTGNWVSASRWDAKDRKPMDPIEVKYQNKAYWAHAAYFLK